MWCLGRHDEAKTEMENQHRIKTSFRNQYKNKRTQVGLHKTKKYFFISEKKNKTESQSTELEKILVNTI